jgi:hypothetical protein
MVGEINTCGAMLGLPSSKSSRDGKRSAIVAGDGGPLVCGCVCGLCDGCNWMSLCTGFNVVLGYVLMLK